MQIGALLFLKIIYLSCLLYVMLWCKDDEDVHEMEQYRANFTFYGLGANEVSFEAGDIVHVIDKNDNGYFSCVLVYVAVSVFCTFLFELKLRCMFELLCIVDTVGWWLLQVGDKEGRAPGSYLEPVDQLSSEPREHGHSTSSIMSSELMINFLHNHTTCLVVGDCYIAVADYVPSVSDEVQLMEGTAVEVLEKNLDGWWKIKCVTSSLYNEDGRSNNDLLKG